MDDVIALFHRYKDPVYRLALSFTGSAADAEDVTQTVLPQISGRPSRSWRWERKRRGCSK